jgi:Na+/melibiose symporter-like transporter
LSTQARLPTLAPFRQRSFRFQWPADLATSCAFEMETIILGWYILTETGSVVWLTAFAALQFLGALISPMFGVAGDRVGLRRLLLTMRVAYLLLAATLMLMALTGTLGTALVLAVALLSGLVRPSDMGIRNALIGATMPAPLLMGAMAIERSSADTARVIGALSGAGLVAWLGLAQAYMVVVALYAASIALLLGVVEPREACQASGRRMLDAAWFDLKEGVAHVRETPPLMAVLALAFLVNLLAYPLSGGLLPHVARNVYGTDQTGLGYLSASFATGALLSSIFLSARGAMVPPGRGILVASATWFALLAAFAFVRDAALGIVFLFVIGAVQSFCMVPMSVLLLRVAREGFRGRVMGLRMLAVYGLPIGLLAAGPLIERAGYASVALAYAAAGLACTVAIGLRWRAHLWRRDAAANGG